MELTTDDILLQRVQGYGSINGNRFVAPPHKSKEFWKLSQANQYEFEPMMSENNSSGRCAQLRLEIAMIWFILPLCFYKIKTPFFENFFQMYFEEQWTIPWTKLRKCRERYCVKLFKAEDMWFFFCLFACFVSIRHLFFSFIHLG